MLESMLRKIPPRLCHGKGLSLALTLTNSKYNLDLSKSQSFFRVFL